MDADEDAGLLVELRFTPGHSRLTLTIGKPDPTPEEPDRMTFRRGVLVEGPPDVVEDEDGERSVVETLAELVAWLAATPLGFDVWVRTGRRGGTFHRRFSEDATFAPVVSGA